MAGALAHAADWKPVDPADLARTTPRVEKDADAEALLWDVRVTHDRKGQYAQAILTHYLRVKIYTDRGREQQSTVDIPYFSFTSISDVYARTVKPDGSVVEMDKSAVHDRVIVKASGLKVRAKSFALPDVTPGSIVEYRWKEGREQLPNYLRLYFQREIPVREVVYHIKPLTDPYFPYAMRSARFNAEQSSFRPEPDGYYETAMENVPAFHEEPSMPPEDQVKAWMLVYYSLDRKLTPEKFWKEYGKEQYTAYKPLMKVNGDVKRLAAEIAGDAQTDDDKAKRLYQHVRKHIKNLNDEQSTAEDRNDAKRNKTPADTLSQGSGTAYDINMLFASLATAAGLDVRVARLADRGDTFFHKEFPDSYFMRTYDIAIKLGDKWKLFDPGSPMVPYGMLRWQEEGEQALLTDSKDPQFIQTPLASASQTSSKRRGTFVLAEDGTLEGDVEEAHSGHTGIRRRTTGASQSEAEREEDVLNRVKHRLSTAEVSEIHIDHMTDPDEPLQLRYHVRVPGYAQRTGKRMFLQPAFFEIGTATRFSAGTRKYDIYFPYPWSEDDVITIKLPESFELDHADAPGSTKIGEIGEYKAEVAVTSKRELKYTRHLDFGKDTPMFFPATAYPQVKKIFDYIHQSDGHSIPLKQTAQKAAGND